MALSVFPNGCHANGVVYVPVDLQAAQELSDRMAGEGQATWQDLCDYWSIFGLHCGWEKYPSYDPRWSFANSIERLDLSCSPIDEPILYHLLPKFPNLRFLNMSECEGITGRVFQYVRLPQLEELDLCRCSNLSDYALVFLSNWGTLSVLNLSECGAITDAGFSYLRRLPCLNKLLLTACTQVGDITLAYLAWCRNLVHLDCSGCYQITDTGVDSIGKLANLEHLDLSCCGDITNVGLANLPRKLKTVVLDHCSQLTNECLEIVRLLPDLEKLSVERCEISGVGILNADFRPEVQIDF